MTPLPVHNALFRRFEVLFGAVAEQGTFALGFIIVISARRIEGVEKDGRAVILAPERRAATEVALQGGHALEHGGEVAPDLIPVAHAAFAAANAVVVVIAEQIHRRERDSGALDHCKAIGLGESGVDQRRLDNHFEVLRPQSLRAVNVLFVCRVAENHDVIGPREGIRGLAFQKPRAWRALV